MADALLAHLVGRIGQDVDFLVQNNYISAQDASTIRARLPQLPSSNVNQMSRKVQNMNLSNVTPVVPQPPPRAVPVQRVQRARAIWAYNEDGTQEDLSFSAGDIIEITSEENADWFTGRHRGRVGLFPSNYVEKINDPAPPAAPAYQARTTYQPPPGGPPHQAQNQLVQQDPELDPAAQRRKAYGASLGNTMAHSVAAGAGATIGSSIVRSIF